MRFQPLCRGAGARSIGGSAAFLNSPPPGTICYIIGRVTQYPEPAMPIVNRIADLQREIAEWRHDLHAHPELLFDVTPHRRRRRREAARASAATRW